MRHDAEKAGQGAEQPAEPGNHDSEKRSEIGSLIGSELAHLAPDIADFLADFLERRRRVLGDLFEHCDPGFHAWIMGAAASWHNRLGAGSEIPLLLPKGAQLG